MTIVLVRIDDRLIHGQIIEGWLKPLNAKHVAVLSDQVAQDKMQKTLLGMAVPNNVKFSCFTLEEGIKKIKEGYFEKESSFILVSSPKDVMNMLDNGIRFSSVNVGGMHYMPGKKQISRTLYLSQEDIKDLIKINEMNVELEGRVLPEDERINLADVVKREPQGKL